MKVTLFIGNGFDIGLELRTQYKQFYEYYKDRPSSTQYIAKMKDDIRDNIELWSDLEDRLRSIARQLSPAEIDDFLDFQDDLIDELSEYLQTQNRKLRSVPRRVLYDRFNEGIDNLKKMLAGDLASDVELDTVINFNYTDSVDYCIKGSEMAPQIIHPHGDLNSRLVVGAYDIPYALPSDFYNQYNYKEVEQWLLKLKVIEYYNELQLRLDSAKEAIDSSDIICTYGISLGESDKFWWKTIIFWMLQDDSRRLVVFSHALNGLKPSKSPRRQSYIQGDALKRWFLSYEEGLNPSQRNSLFQRITVLPDTGIFDMAGIINRKHIRIMEEAPY